MDLIQNQKLQITPMLLHQITPEEVPEAYKGLKDNKDEYLGVVIDWTK